MSETWRPKVEEVHGSSRERYTGELLIMHNVGRPLWQWVTRAVHNEVMHYEKVYMLWNKRGLRTKQIKAREGTWTRDTDVCNVILPRNPSKFIKIVVHV